MARWYIVDAFFSLNGIHLNEYMPKCMVAVVLSQSLGVIRNRLYPEFASKVLKTFLYPRLCILSSILDIEFASRIVMALMRLKSTQDRSVPSFFDTNTTGFA